MRDYSSKADAYLKQCRAIYGNRINNGVVEFVRGFAWYLEKGESKRVYEGKIALITENNNHLTGGRYYTWTVALALTQAGYDVTIYTDRKPKFLDYFKDFKQPKIEIVGSRPSDLSNADIKAEVYIGSPIHGALSAVRNGKKYSKPSYAMIFDPFPMLADYRRKSIFQGWDQLVKEIKTSDCNILSLCYSIHPYIHDWLDKTEDQIVPIYPCINSKVLATVPDQERDDYVLFISRLVPNKKLDHVLAACKDARVNLKIITSASGIDHNRLIESAGMVNRTEVLFNVSDYEKFVMLKKARALIVGSHYEGWGIPITEALACGTPVVCYQYPTFTEIKNHCLADNIYMAKLEDKKDLGYKLIQALDERKYRDPATDFNFGCMVSRVKEIWH